MMKVATLHLEDIENKFGVGDRAIQQFILLISNRKHDYPKQETYLDSRKRPGTFEHPTNAHIYDLTNPYSARQNMFFLFFSLWFRGDQSAHKDRVPARDQGKLGMGPTEEGDLKRRATLSPSITHFISCCLCWRRGSHFDDIFPELPYTEKQPHDTGKLEIPSRSPPWLIQT